MVILSQYLIGQFSLLQMLDFFLRLLVSCLCGACIGVERTRRLKEAGIRTHMIVCCSAALLMIVSKYGFADLTNEAGILFNGTRGADPARIAAQVVSGISFLGAGIIFKNGSTIKGLTTAAGIWATAGIGLAVGAGMYPFGILSTAVLILMQVLMHKYRFGMDSLVTHHLQFTVRDTPDFGKRFAAYAAEQKMQIIESRIGRGEGGAVTYDVVVRMKRVFTVEELEGFLEKNREVENASCRLMC